MTEAVVTDTLTPEATIPREVSQSPHSKHSVILQLQLLERRRVGLARGWAGDEGLVGAELAL